MKRFLLVLAVLAATSSIADAQSFKNFFSAAKKALEEQVIKTSLSQDTLVGEWSYQKPIVKLQSSNILAQIGSESLSPQIGDKLSPYLEKLGIKEGCFSISFSSEGKVSTVVLGKTLTGTYSISEDGKTLNIGYKAEGKTFPMVMSLSGDNLSIMLDSEKFMSFIQTIVEHIPSSSGTMDAIKSLLKNYDSILLGFEFSRKAD